jgi:hypothetical protein
MENFNEQEYIKDPNQLDLFAGILLTPEQDKIVEEFIKNQSHSAFLAEKRIQQNEKLLIDNGFIYGMDFINTYKIETVTQEVTLGSSWNKNQFEIELTYERGSGGIFLKGKRFYSNELKDSTFSIEFDGNKVQCPTIQDNYRYIKPATLLEKLKIYSERAETLFEDYKKKTNLKGMIVEKYTKLYPNAIIITKKEWSKYSGDFDIIEVKFDSGSYIQFRLDTYRNTEYIYKKYDAEFEKMGADELLERFSKQVKKEALN